MTDKVYYDNISCYNTVYDPVEKKRTLSISIPIGIDEDVCELLQAIDHGIWSQREK